MAKLGELCKMQSGGTPRRNVTEYYNGTIPWVKISDIEDAENGVIINTEERISDAGLKSINNRLFPKGTLLLAMYGSVGKTAVLGSEMSTNQAILGIQVIDPSTLNLKYLKHWFDYFKNELVGRARGVALQNISLSIVKDLEIPLPPLEEQKRIAEVLDKADRLRQKDRQLLDHYDQLLQSVFLDMFGAANPDSANWKEICIKDITAANKGSMRTGPFGSDLLHSEFVDEGVFVLGIDNVVNNTFEWGKARFITEQKYEKLKRYKVYPGDVLVSIMATTGRTAVVPDDMPEAINSKHLAAITLNREVADPTFISYSLHSDPKVVFQLTAQNRGAIMNGLNLGIIKETKINLPPIALQQHFAMISAQIETLKKTSKKSIETSETLFQSLLQKAFKGELALWEVETVEERR